MAIRHLLALSVLTAAVFVASDARADLLGTQGSTARAPARALVPAAPLAAAEYGTAIDLGPRPIEHEIADLLGGGQVAPAFVGLPPAPQGAAIRELPAAPGSASLFLSAVLAFGACSACRNARNIHLSHLPEWYHAGAPAQIGHTLVFDLNFRELLPAVFATVCDAGDSSTTLLLRLARQAPSRIMSGQHVLAVAAPRGPPFA